MLSDFEPRPHAKEPPGSVAGRRLPFAPVAALLLAGSVLFASEAAAGQTGPGDPFTTWSPTISLGYRHGTTFERRSANAWGNGMGLTVGYTLGPLLHVGLSYDSFGGDRLTTSEVTTVGFGTVSDYEQASTAELLGFVGGDGAVSKNLVVRVFVGAGMADFERVVCVRSECEDHSGSQVVLSPGLWVLRKTPVGSFVTGMRWSLTLTEPDATHALVFSLGWAYAG